MKLKPSGNPVRPPMPNIGRKAKANMDAGLNRIDPFHSVINRQVRRITDGIDMIMVVVWKKVATFALIPVRYMWCAQTIKDRKPKTNSAATITL